MYNFFILHTLWFRHIIPKINFLSQILKWLSWDLKAERSNNIYILYIHNKTQTKTIPHGTPGLWNALKKLRANLLSTLTFHLAPIQASEPWHFLGLTISLEAVHHACYRARSPLSTHTYTDLWRQENHQLRVGSIHMYILQALSKPWINSEKILRRNANLLLSLQDHDLLLSRLNEEASILSVND